MNTATKQKIEELEGVRIRARKIMEEHKAGLPPEEDLAVTTLLDKAKELRGEIESEQKLEQKMVELANLNDYLDSPTNRLPLSSGINGDTDERKALLRAGWEIKGGMLNAPTSLEGSTMRFPDGRIQTIGKISMWPEEVVFGDIPQDDPDTAKFYLRTRAIFSPQYKTVYQKFVRNSVKYRSEAMSFNMLSGAEQKALSEGSDTSGGFVVPPDIQAEILVRTAQTSVMRQNCRVQPTNRDILKWPAVQPNAGTYGGVSGASIYSSGFVGSWVGETPAFTDTDPSFYTLDIPIRKVRVATRLSNDFVADAATNILAWLAMNGSENMSLTEDQGFINGAGVALQPLGILNVPGITQVNVAGTTSHTISNTTSSLGSATALITMAYALPAQYVARAKWIMRRTIEGEIRQLVDGSGRFLWPPFVGGGFAEVGPNLLGFPVLHSDWMPTDGTANNVPLILGDFTNYIIGQRTEITSLILRERFADVDQVGIILFERVGGAAFNTDAFRTGYVS